MTVEGLLIDKIPYGEYHLIGRFLLRSGRSAGVIFYGGQKGGKKAAPLELGALLHLELSLSPKKRELYTAKEWAPVWAPKNIRHNPNAFYTMCFYFEILRKVALEEDLYDPHLQKAPPEGLFNVLSNALFYLDGHTPLPPPTALALFLGKLLIQQGLFPRRDHCALCGRELSPQASLHLGFEHGSFLCCGPYEKGGRPLWELLGLIAYRSYQTIPPKAVDPDMAKSLVHYFCFHLHLREQDFKSLPLLL